MGSERQVTFWSSLSKLVSCEITKYLNPDDRKIDAMNSIWSPLNHTLDFFFSSLLGKIAGKFFWASVWQKPHPLSICKTNIGSFFSSWYSIICLLTCRVDLYTLCAFLGWIPLQYIVSHLQRVGGEAKGGIYSTSCFFSFINESQSLFGSKSLKLKHRKIWTAERSREDTGLRDGDYIRPVRFWMGAPLFSVRQSTN